jgi:anaerobic selenocysteine-containing dehydrogenase
MWENQEHPYAKVFAPTVRSCPRAKAAADWYHHPDRLNFPLKRIGNKGEGKWEQITWEQALDEIAAKLGEIKKQYGAEAVANTTGTGRTHDEYRRRFFNLFGSPNNIGQGHICWGISNMVAAMMLGWASNFPSLIPEVTNAILLIGTNPHQSNRALWFGITGVKRAGGKLIVIDPRKTELAEIADVWLQPRPGTDCTLLMSMINVIIEEGLYDKEFVERWCHGFDKLTERARQYEPEKAEEITWVPAEKIREAARIYAASKPAASRNEMGLEHIRNAVEALHARFILSAITGNVDIKGADVLRGIPTEIISEDEIELNDIMSQEQKRKQLGSDKFKLLSWEGYDFIQENVKKVWGKKIPAYHHCMAPQPNLIRAIIDEKPYPVKAMITASSNPMVTSPNVKLIYKALKKLELYVVFDFWMTPSAELADYVLPCASWLERPCLYTGMDVTRAIDAGEAAFPPVKEGAYERWTDFDFWRGLGIRLGQEEYWPWRTLEESFDYRLSPLGYTFKEFIEKAGGVHLTKTGYQKHEQRGFGTPTGKVELYSSTLEKLGYDPLPQYYEPAESPISSPELAKEYPLILTTGSRHQPFYHSEHRQVESLRIQHPDPIAQIHPQTASELGINDGDWVWIETPRGRIKQKCQHFDGMDPRVVNAQHGWWFPELPGEEPWLHGAWESNINVITDDDPEHCNKISGGWPLRGLLCRVYKMKRY